VGEESSIKIEMMIRKAKYVENKAGRITKQNKRMTRVSSGNGSERMRMK